MSVSKGCLFRDSYIRIVSQNIKIKNKNRLNVNTVEACYNQREITKWTDKSLLYFSEISKENF